MRNTVSIKFFLALLCTVIIFHVCIIVKIVPYDIAWGGRLTNDKEMYVFEFTSILINLFLGFVLLMKGGFIKYYFKQRIVDGILWIFFVLFVLNTVGNLLAKTNFEKLFSVLTLISAVLIWMILKRKQTENTDTANSVE